MLEQEIIDRHPCFGASKGLHGRIHLPVAPLCNISCGFCSREIGCLQEVRPGVTEKIMTPEEALEYIKINDNEKNNLQVVGIAGPGEPLYNENTFRTLELVNEKYPEKVKCLSTNGLLLPEKIQRLKALKVDSISITINTLNVKTAMAIYNNYSEKTAKTFLENQQAGARAVVKNEIFLKINTVLIPEINAGEIREIAMFCQSVGAHIMNIIPLIPMANFKNLKAPSSAEIERARVLASCFISQHTGCAQCRADAVGIPKCCKH